MPRFHRRTATKVKDGKVQRKNRTRTAPTIYDRAPGPVRVVREKPGVSWRHVIRKQDIERFVGLLPDWDQLSVGLNTILLAAGSMACFGWYRPGVIALCAAPREVDIWWDAVFRLRYISFLRRLRVKYAFGWFEPDWVHTDAAVRAFLLLDTFLHELGHHHDRLETGWYNRGEKFADAYAYRYGRIVVERYAREFGFEICPVQREGH